MLAKRPVGQGAAAKKYDVLTALGVYACGSCKFTQRRVLRFLTLVTARYNWQREELAIGRADLARLWQIDERSVKRDIARLRDTGWMTVKRPAARGRVAVYTIDWSQVLTDTRDAWEQVGPDFAVRVQEMLAPAGADPGGPTVVSFPQGPSAAGVWGRIAAWLHREDPGFYAAWIAPLVEGDVGQGVLHLHAPSRFHAAYVESHARTRIDRARAACAPQITRIEIVCP